MAKANCVAFGGANTCKDDLQNDPSNLKTISVLTGTGRCARIDRIISLRFAASFVDPMYLVTSMSIATMASADNGSAGLALHSAIHNKRSHNKAAEENQICRMCLLE
jgi:hypothetical protein